MPNFADPSAPKLPIRKRSTKREMMLRDARIMDRLAAGLSIEELAAREGISPRRARDRVSAMLKREAANHPAEYVELQIRRLSEALLVAYSAMGGANLEAVDRVVKIVRELDRYYFGPGVLPASLIRPPARPQAKEGQPAAPLKLAAPAPVA
ncbi:MAG TPA: hypothetical protein VMI72_09935 [Roseiarcus sp.]|nr:hypothetical protein [Roseiarcus sp.]